MDSVSLSQTTLKRLARLQARAEGAFAVFQAAQTAAQLAQTTLQQELTEACADEGLAIPQDNQTQVDIDWKTGEVRLRESSTLSPNGVPEPAF